MAKTGRFQEFSVCYQAVVGLQSIFLDIVIVIKEDLFEWFSSRAASAMYECSTIAGVEETYDPIMIPIIVSIRPEHSRSLDCMNVYRYTDIRYELHI